MPTYNYYCDECDNYFELSHSMIEVIAECINCDSINFDRIPSIPAYIQQPKIEKKSKAGDLVEEYIKQNQKSIQKEKDRLKKVSYKKGEE